jgi:hypothetical protein
MKLKIGLIILIILLTFTTAFALIDESKILDELATSINEHPEHWIDTGSLFVYCDDSAKMKHLKKLSWPDHDSNLVIRYHFHTTFNYIKLEKPFEYDFKDKLLKELRQAIQLYKLKKLMGEVGNLLEKKSEPEVGQIKPQKEETIGEDFNKL